MGLPAMVVCMGICRWWGLFLHRLFYSFMVNPILVRSQNGWLVIYLENYVVVEVPGTRHKSPIFGRRAILYFCFNVPGKQKRKKNQESKSICVKGHF